MLLISVLAFATLVTVAYADSGPWTLLSVSNHCLVDVYINTETSKGYAGPLVSNGNIPAGQTFGFTPSRGWQGAIDIGTDCGGGFACQTGAPAWDGTTPFTKALFNFDPSSAAVTFAIDLSMGYNVGAAIYVNATYAPQCKPRICNITSPSACPVPGPENSCYSACCSTPGQCEESGVTLSGQGCVLNFNTTMFYLYNCPDAIPNALIGPKFYGNYSSMATCSDPGTLTLVLCADANSTVY